MYSTNLAGTVDAYDRHVFLCYKTPESWPSRVESSNEDPLPKLLASSVKAHKQDITVKTKVTICGGGEGSDGDVLIFLELIKYNLQQDGFNQQQQQQQQSKSATLPKEKKGRAPAPLWYITVDELDSLSSYMRGRLTLKKVNAVVNDMAAYAEANTQLVVAPKKKLSENLWDKALELRDIAMREGVKGKHFFLEVDIKGPSLKLDNTGKAILTVLRHLGRISETRIGPHRVIILLRPPQ